MSAKGKAVLFGFIVWLVAFAAAFVIFPLRESARPLFESIMPVVLSAATAALAVIYFRGVTRDHLKEGVALGVLWLVINVLVDAPLMLLGGPMKMTVGAYTADIGVTYLLIPAVTIGIGAGIANAARSTSDG